ncbi:MAG: thioredoxin domain-containing protein [Acholeplasmataceae bacterium]
MLFDLNNGNFDEYITKDELVLVEFYAKWCQNCLQLEYILEDILDDHFDTLKIYKINVELESGLSDKYNVFNLPTLILFKSGKPIKTLINLQSKDNIMKWLEL